LQCKITGFQSSLVRKTFADGLDANAELIRQTGIDSEGELTLDVKRFTDQ
jgi:hypothetical protein